MSFFHCHSNLYNSNIISRPTEQKAIKEAEVKPIPSAAALQKDTIGNRKAS